MNKPKWGQLYRLKHDAVGKPRIIVIVSREEINGGHSVLAVPFTSQQLDKRKSLDYCAHFYPGEGGLELECVAKTDELSLYDKTHIRLADGPVGQFDKDQMERLCEALKWSLKI